MQIGDYFLGQNISDCSHLMEISQPEYKALPIMFQGEKILRAPDAIFLGYSWDMVLGVTNHHVYKLSAQFISDNASMTDMVYLETIRYCSKQYGTPSSGKNLPSFLMTSYERSGWAESEINGVMFWNASFGNIVVDRKSLFDDHYVNLQATSRSLVKESRLLFPRITPVQTVLKANLLMTSIILALVLSAVAAYALSSAGDLLMGGLFRVFPNTAFLPALTWLIIAIVSFILAVKISSLRSWLSIPFAVFGVLALVGGFIGTHPHSFGVGLVMFIAAVFVWRIARRTSCSTRN